jgi:hypothetical protein
VTIIASVKVHDGVVLGADSVTQISAQTPMGVQFVKSYRHANKLFQIEDLPIGVTTYGAGNIGSRTIESYVLEFSQKERLDPETDKNVQAVATRLQTFMRTAYDGQFGQLPPDQKPVLGMLLAGYSPMNPLAEEWEFALPNDAAPKAVRPNTQFGASWRGISMPFTRLFFGFDPRIQARLVALGVAQNLIDQVKQEFPSLSMNFDGMPLQDAVNFVHFIISTTVYTAAFEVGVASCGGPIDIGLVDQRRQFRWVVRKEISAPNMGGSYAY